MLDLDDAERDSFNAKYALTVDQDGQEVLVGLTLDESHYFVAFEKYPVELHTPGEIRIYYQLKHHHLVARASNLITAARRSLPSSRNSATK